jgi:hypothetical protein
MRKIVFLGLRILMASALMAQKSKSVFLEVGGNGGLLSVNFDSRLTNSEKGLGYRAGFGMIPPFFRFFVSRPTIWTVPVGLNYLVGGSSHYLETGVGATYYFFNGTVSSVWGISDNAKGNGVVFIPNVGYRYAPDGKSIQARAFICPLINSSGAIFYWGFSGGYKF